MLIETCPEPFHTVAQLHIPSPHNRSKADSLVPRMQPANKFILKPRPRIIFLISKISEDLHRVLGDSQDSLLQKWNRRLRNFKKFSEMNPNTHLRVEALP